MKVSKRTLGMFLSRFGTAMARGNDNIPFTSVGFVEEVAAPSDKDDVYQMLSWFEAGGNQKYNRIGNLVAFHYDTNSVSVDLEDGSVQRIQVSDKLALRVYSTVNVLYIYPSTIKFEHFYERARKQLRTFNKYVKSGVPMLHNDIFRYASWKELRDDMLKAELHSSKRSVSKLAKTAGLKCVINNSKMKVYHILTYEGACIIGKGTRWCISGTDDPKYQVTWNRYNNHSAIFVVVEKHRKTAVIAGWHPDSVKIYNEADKEVPIKEMEFLWQLGIRQLMQLGGITPPLHAKPPPPLRPIAGLGSVQDEPLNDDTARYRIVQSKIRGQSIHRAPPQMMNIEYEFIPDLPPQYLDIPKDFKMTFKTP